MGEVCINNTCMHDVTRTLSTGSPSCSPPHFITRVLQHSPPTHLPPPPPSIAAPAGMGADVTHDSTPQQQEGVLQLRQWLAMEIGHQDMLRFYTDVLSDW